MAAYADIIIADYQERSQDLRRQRGHYVLLAKAFFLIIVSTIGWFVATSSSVDGQPDGSIQFALPLVVIASEICLMFTLFVWGSCRIMKIYVLESETKLRHLLPADERMLTVFKPGKTDGSAGSIMLPFGFEGWRTSLHPSIIVRLVMVGPPLLASLLLVLPVINSLQSEFYDQWASIARWTAVVLLLLPIPACALLYIMLERYYRQAWPRLAESRPLATVTVTGATEEKELSPDEIGQILIADMMERNADYRAMIDRYPQLLIAFLSVLFGFAGAYLQDGATYDWLWLIVPPLILVILAGFSVTFSQAKKVRVYLSGLEYALDRRCQSHRGTAGAFHLGEVRLPGRKVRQVQFHVGFFRIIRERKFASAMSQRFPVSVAILAGVPILCLAAVLGYCMWQSYLWIFSHHRQYACVLIVSHWALCGLILGASVWVFARAGVRKD